LPPSATLFPYTTLFRSGRHTPVVEPDRIDLPALPRSRRHALGFGSIHRHRLFASDNLSRFESGNRNIVMGVVGRADVDDANFGRSEEHTSELQSRENLV